MADVALSSVPVGIGYSDLTAGQLALLHEAQQRLIGLDLSPVIVRAWIGLRKLVLYATSPTTFKVVGQVAGNSRYRLLATVDTGRGTPLLWLVGSPGWVTLPTPEPGTLPDGFLT